eukprot:Sspe_Gene.8704::Locus_2943_Transcript_1_8_Confidence_0.182_Length_1472::g.8704::m.8704/K02684/PRI1; DNA primase small subunit
MSDAAVTMDVDEEKAPEAMPFVLEQEALHQYYKNFFPHELFYRWLSYGKQDLFRKREFSFTKSKIGFDGKKAEIYSRYRSFDNVAEFKAALVSWGPEKIDIGAIYSHPPKAREKALSFQTIERELVFDIDASDYDNVRDCCQDKRICEHCWPFMAVGMKVLDHLLEHDFGLKHRLWVYSGRRGIHCWVGDAEARKYNDEARAAVARHLEVWQGGGKEKDDVSLTIEHDLQRNQGWLPLSLQEVHASFVRPGFRSIVLNLGNPNNLTNPTLNRRIRALIAKRIPASQDSISSAVADIIERVESTRQSVDLAAVWGKVTDKLRQAKPHSLEWVAMVVEFAFVYPRLDVGVSTHRNHLLKSPFAIHPGTGFVCVPITPHEVDTFHPFVDAPHLSKLMKAFESEGAVELPRVDLLAEFVRGIEQEEGRVGLTTAVEAQSP